MKTYVGLAAVFAAATLVCAAQGTQTQSTTQESTESSQTKTRTERRHTQSANRATTDTNFVMKAARGGMAEVELGKLAQEKASSQAVKDFGQRMVTDHSKANDELNQIAQQKNITLPTTLPPREEALKNRLSKLSGAEFDRAYMAAMVRDHKEDVAEFRREANSGQDPDVKAFASKTLPTLEDHLKAAEQTHSETKK